MRWDARWSGSGTGPLGLRGSGSGVLEVEGVNSGPSRPPPPSAVAVESEMEIEWSRICRNLRMGAQWRKHE